MTAATRTPWWALACPGIAWVILMITVITGAGGVIASAAGAALIATVFAAVYHAEVVATGLENRSARLSWLSPWRL